MYGESYSNNGFRPGRLATDSVIASCWYRYQMSTMQLPCYYNLIPVPLLYQHLLVLKRSGDLTGMTATTGRAAGSVWRRRRCVETRTEDERWAALTVLGGSRSGSVPLEYTRDVAAADRRGNGDGKRLTGWAING
jgi:hypothetical protein